MLDGVSFNPFTIAGKRVANELKRPGATEAGKAPVWNDTLKKYEAGGFDTLWQYGGNTVGAIKNFGTIDNYSLPFIVNNIERARFDTSGNFVIGATSASGRFHVRGAGTGTGYLLYADNSALTNVFHVKENGEHYFGGHINTKSAIRTGWAGNNDVSDTVSHYFWAAKTSHVSLVRINGSGLTNSLASPLTIVAPTSIGSFDKAGGNYSGGTIDAPANGINRVGFSSKLTHKNGVGFSISNGVADHDQIMGHILYYSITMTGNATNPLLYVRKRGLKDIYDHTGAFIEMVNDLNGSGDFINANNGVNNKFRVTYLGSTIIEETQGYYIGDPATDGTWVMIRNGNDLIFQRREVGAYVTKQTIAA